MKFAPFQFMKLNFSISYVNTVILPVLCTLQLLSVTLGKKFGSRCMEMGCSEDISTKERESSVCSEKITIHILVYLLIRVVAAYRKMLLEHLILPNLIKKFRIFY